MFEHDIRFWLAVVGAAIFKLFTSTHTSVTRAILTGAVAIYCPYVFSEPAMRILAWDSTYLPIIAALLTLTGEGIMRWVTKLTPAELIALWKETRK